MTERGITPSQTVGPFFSFALTPAANSAHADIAGGDLVTEDTVGEPIVIAGRVLDGEGAPVPDAMIEIWQADGAGRYPSKGAAANTAFRGFGRSETGGAGFRFKTVKPGHVPGPDGKEQAPHINVSIFARGVLRRMFTRIYFEGEPGNDDDPALRLVPADRRSTLIARRDGTARFAFDIRLQGEGETVFFEA
jgi:protocatechuate 3,4-dioxygenase alpha subunit